MYIHPSSSLFNHTPPIKTLLYYELVMTSKSYMRYFTYHIAKNPVTNAPSTSDRQVMEIKPAWLLEGTLHKSAIVPLH